MNLFEFFTNTFIIIFSNMILKLVNFFLLPLYTEYLTPEMLGVSDSILIISGVLFPALVMGLDSAFAVFYNDKGINQKERVFNTIFFFLVFMGLLPLFLTIFANDVSLTIFGTEEYYYVILIAFVSISLDVIKIPFIMKIRMDNRILIYSSINITTSVVNILLNILFLTVLNLNVISMILSIMISNALGLLIFAIFSKATISKRYFNRALISTMLKYSLPLLPTVLMMWVLSLSDRYVILYFLGSAEVGIYGIANRFATIINVIASAIRFSYTTFAFSNKDDINGKDKFEKIFDIVIMLLSILCFTISIFSKSVVGVMTTDNYSSAGILIRDLVYSQMLLGITSIVSYGIVFSKKSVYTLIATGVGAILNFVLNMLLIPLIGTYGAAISTLIGYLTYFFVAFFYSQKLYKCNYKLIKASSVVALSYLISFFGMNLSILFQLLLWIIGVLIISFLYYSNVKEVFIFSKSYLNNFFRKK